MQPRLKLIGQNVVKGGAFDWKKAGKCLKVKTLLIFMRGWKNRRVIW